MPTYPSNSKCSHLGCKEQRSRLNTFCKAHGGMDSFMSDKRKEHSKEYQGRTWRRIRLLQLSKHPICQGCMLHGRITQSYHVDHLFPWTSLGKEAFTYNIFQSLCVECHSYKTSMERKGVVIYFGNALYEFKLTDYSMVMAEYSRNLNFERLGTNKPAPNKSQCNLTMRGSNTKIA